MSRSLPSQEQANCAESGLPSPSVLFPSESVKTTPYGRFPNSVKSFCHPPTKSTRTSELQREESSNSKQKRICLSLLPCTSSFVAIPCRPFSLFPSAMFPSSLPFSSPPLPLFHAGAARSAHAQMVTFKAPNGQVFCPCPPVIEGTHTPWHYAEQSTPSRFSRLTTAAGPVFRGAFSMEAPHSAECVHSWVATHSWKDSTCALKFASKDPEFDQPFRPPLLDVLDGVLATFL